MTKIPNSKPDEIVKSHFADWIPAFAGMMDWDNSTFYETVKPDGLIKSLNPVTPAGTVPDLNR